MNRYLLVVKGIKGSKAKVTWASQTKEFAAADLAKGVNLAAEFLSILLRAVLQGQRGGCKAAALETTLVKQYMHNVPAFTAMVPNEADSLHRVTLEGIEQDKRSLQLGAGLGGSDPAHDPDRVGAVMVADAEGIACGFWSGLIRNVAGFQIVPTGFCRRHPFRSATGLPACASIRSTSTRSGVSVQTGSVFAASPVSNAA